MTHSDAVGSQLQAPLLPAQWLSRLIVTQTPDDVASLLVEHAQAQSGCLTARVVWGLEDGADVHSVPPDAHTAPQRDWLAQVCASDGPCSHPDQQHAAIRLCREPVSAVLQVQLQPGCDTADFFEAMEAAWRLAGHRLASALAWVQMQGAHKNLARSELLQRALFAISDLAGADRDMPQMLRGIHGIVSTLMYAENFFIVLRDAERHTIRFLYFVDVHSPPPFPLGEDLPLHMIEHTLTWYVMTDGKPRMGDAEKLRSQVAGPVKVIGNDSHDWLGVPMMRDGMPRGGLVVQSYRAEIGFSDEDLTLLQFVGSHILTALERKQGKDELEQRVQLRTRQLAEANRGLQLQILERQRAEQLQAALFQIAELATADIDQAAFYLRVHAIVGELLNAENFFIALLSDDRQRLTFPYSVDAVKAPPAERPLSRGLSEYVLKLGRALRVDNADIEDLERRGHVASGRMDAPAMCWLGVPLIVDDEAIGLVAVQSYRPDVIYGAADQELLSFVALQVANSLMRRRSAQALRHAYGQLEVRVEERTQALRNEIAERERIQDQLRHQVMHDPLTGLPNRSYLRERIERVLSAMRHAPELRCALLYLDVDRFKVINDSLGHLAGDDVLKEVANRLAACVRHPDLVARLSGDEFAILLEPGDLPPAATAIAQRVLDALAEPMEVCGKELQVSASVGIALGDDHYVNADDVLRDADIALYRAKELGRKRFELFDETLARDVIDVLALEGELRQALLYDQFEPYFQPILALDGSARVLGYEALIRWNHPQRGVLAPGTFLRVAEDSGLIESIDWRMFELSCQALLQYGQPDTFMTINVSALHLRHADFDGRLVKLLERTGLEPSRLVVEITEGALLDKPERVRGMLDRLLTIGVGAALDDFGTGYSSLSYLHSLPLRILKIDRSFVEELDKGAHTSGTTVVAAILALARALNIRVIAEGIETSIQHEALMAMSCAMGQGYLLGRPAPITHWLESAATDV